MLQAPPFHSMFESVDVEVLDISTFDTSKVTDMRGMLAWNNKLTTIIVGDKWDTSKVYHPHDGSCNTQRRTANTHCEPWH